VSLRRSRTLNFNAYGSSSGSWNVSAISGGYSSGLALSSAYTSAFSSSYSLPSYSMSSYSLGSYSYPSSYAYSLPITGGAWHSSLTASNLYMPDVTSYLGFGNMSTFSFFDQMPSYISPGPNSGLLPFVGSGSTSLWTSVKLYGKWLLGFGPEQYIFGQNSSFAGALKYDVGANQARRVFAQQNYDSNTGQYNANALPLSRYEYSKANDASLNVVKYWANHDSFAAAYMGSYRVSICQTSPFTQRVTVDNDSSLHSYTKFIPSYDRRYLFNIAGHRQKETLFRAPFLQPGSTTWQWVSWEEPLYYTGPK